MKPIQPRLLVPGLAIIYLLLGVLSGSLGWYFQFIAVTVTGIAICWFSYRKFNGNYKPILWAILPFYILFTTASIYSKSYATFPIWILGILSCAVTYLSMKYTTNLFLRIAITIPIPLLGFFFIMPNNFAYIDQKSDLRPYQFDKALILNEAGGKIELRNLKGKVVLFDIWHSACLPCIRKFTDLQALQDKYANDSLVKIFAINIPLEKDRGEKPVKFTQSYSFNKLYFANEHEAEKLSVDEVPLILIFDKNLKCCYAGGLNIKWNIFIGNAEKIIDKLKSEE